MKRYYRETLRRPYGEAFEVRFRQTDLWIWAHKDLREQAQSSLLEARMQLEAYIEQHPEFMDSHVPLPRDPVAPAIVKEMLESSRSVGVGPMAAVAGAIAQFVGRSLLGPSPEVIVENGGDVFLSISSPCVVAIYAGSSTLSGVIGVRIEPQDTPMGVCTSSSTVGHSWSYGLADAAVVLARDASLADAAATALCNRVQGKDAMESQLDWILEVEGIEGAVVIVGDVIGAKGKVQLCPL